MWCPHSTHAHSMASTPPLTSTVKSSLFMHVHSSPLFLPDSYIDAMQTILIILTTVGLFPDRPRMYHIFIQSSTGGHLGCFHVLLAIQPFNLKMKTLRPRQVTWLTWCYSIGLYKEHAWKQSHVYGPQGYTLPMTGAFPCLQDGMYLAQSDHLLSKF